MADTTVDITDILGAFQKLLKITDNGDGTYSVAVGLSGMTLGPRVQTPPAGNVLQVQGGVMDIIAGLPVMIDYDQHQSHEGEYWGYQNYVASLTSGSSKDFLLIVPNITVPADVPVAARMPHLRFTVASADGIDVFLYRAPTVTGAGTQRLPENFEENGTYTAQMQIWEDPTVSAVGTLRDRAGVLVTAPGKTGGEFDAKNERIMKNNTTYLFRVTSNATPNKILVHFRWYEDLGV
jgi:hypothetical protein